MFRAIFALFVLAILLKTLTVGAQNNLSPKSQKNVVPRHNVPVTITVTGGTQGIGADVKVGILKKLALRAGWATLPVTANNVFSVSDLNANDGLKVSFTNVHLFVDYSIFGGNFFRLVGGAAYFTKASADIEVTPSGDFKFGNIVYTSDMLGALQASLSWQGVAPYAGISLFRAFPKKVFNVNLDVGSYYLKAPQGLLTGTGALSGNSQNDKQLTENASGYRWLPVAQLDLNFKL